MKTILFGLALSLLAPVTALAHPTIEQQSPSMLIANAGTGTQAQSCSSISDADDRQFCYAKEKNDANACSSIKDGDKRLYCTAVVTKQKNSCSSIRDNDMRGRCQSEVK
jgi:hypothetical protein